MGLLLVSLRGGGGQQGPHGQGNLLLLLVHGGDLRLHGLALGEHVAGLLDAPVGDLGDVDEGTTSAKAPKVISFTIRTLAVSPTW